MFESGNVTPEVDRLLATPTRWDEARNLAWSSLKRSLLHFHEWLGKHYQQHSRITLAHMVLTEAGFTPEGALSINGALGERQPLHILTEFMDLPLFPMEMRPVSSARAAVARRGFMPPRVHNRTCLLHFPEGEADS